MRRSVEPQHPPARFLEALDRLAQDPLVPIALRDLVETMKALDPTLQYLTPGADGLQLRRTCCFRNASFLLSEGDANGTWLRFVPIITPQGPNNETGPSSAPASGGGPDQDELVAGTSSTSTRIRTPPGPARRASARPPTRGTCQAGP